MRIPRPHHYVRKGLKHPNRAIQAATWLLVLLLAAVLVRLVMRLIDDFWLILITLSQP